MSNEFTASGKNMHFFLTRNALFSKEVTLKHEKHQSRHEKHQSNIQNNQLTSVRCTNQTLWTITK